jgi:CDP-diglyceride synthetase
MTESGYKRMFLIGALWNLVGGAFIILATRWVFDSAGISLPSPPLYYYAWIALFMTYGIGYYLVYRNLYRNRDIVLLGAIGKLVFAIVFIWNFIAYASEVPRFFLIPVAGDLVFVVFFVMFLRFASGKKGQA